MSSENLFLNTLAFKFPKDPVTFYFSLTDRKDVNLTKLNHQLFPLHIHEIFPDIKLNKYFHLSPSNHQLMTEKCPFAHPLH